MKSREIVLATNNKNKVIELKEIFSEFDILTLNDIGFKDEIIEDGTTFAENALIKARVIHKYTNKTVIADDSGICVNALKGAPGIFSARYYSEKATDLENNQKLLSKMLDIDTSNRGAKYVSAAALILENGDEFVEYGEIFGQIAFDMIGNNGFGYDPLFIIDSLNKRMSQITLAEKNKISHRKIAFEKLRPTILNFFDIKK